MVRIVDDVLIKLGVDPKQWASGLGQATAASNKFFATLKKNTVQLSALTLASGFSLRAQRQFIEDVTKSAATQEAAIARLESSLKSEQRTRKDSIAVLTKQASELQKTTVFGDEQTIAAQGVLAGFKLTDDQILKLTPHLQDLNTFLSKTSDEQISLEDTAKLLGKAMSGNADALSRYGVQLGIAKGETADVDKVTSVLQYRFGGLAVAMGETAAGRMKQFANAVDDVKEELGGGLLPIIRDVIHKVTPLVVKFGEWAKAHRDVVLAIMGGGIAGSGLIAAFGALGTALALFGAAAGPIGIAILGISTLVGWLIKLKVESMAAVPRTLDDVKNAMFETQKYIDELKKYQQQLGRVSPQSVFAQATGGIGKASFEASRRLTEAEERMAGLRKQYEALMAAMDKEKPAEPGAESGAGGGGAPAYSPIEAYGAKNLPRYEVGVQAAIDIVNEGNKAIIESEQERYERQKQMLEDHNQMVAEKTASVALLWGDMFGQVLESENNFAKAFGKATILAMIKIINVEVQTAIQKILVAKVTELGKAAIGAPLSFGATLAATGPIIAASAAAIGLLQAIQGKVAKSLGGFNEGGVVSRTGHYLMHEGEVVYNPRRNSARDLARNLARAGAGGEAMAVAGGLGGMNVNFNGPVRSQADVILAMNRVRRDWQRALGSYAG